METLKILFLAANWRVSLVRAFQNAKAGCDTPFQLIAVDSDALAPALQAADRSHSLPLFSDSSCLESLLVICRTQAVDAIIPLTNKAIDFLNTHREELSGSNRRLVIQESSTIEICHDKWNLSKFMELEGFNSPKTFLLAESDPPDIFPLIAKERTGEGGKNQSLIEDQQDLDYCMEKYPNHIFQELIRGREFSVDLFADIKGNPQLIVPRERLSVRGGEVMTSKIDMNESIIDLVEALSRRLALTGPCTIQGILDDSGTFFFTDLNLRFGSGTVHTIAAGGNIPLMIYQEMAGQEFYKPSIKDQSIMARYPESIFHHP
ncbi:MAG: ATP-grasp domain-containing protein [Nitrospina sp.]|jgi:carbamoyl-phosphate synthase large subunit|nr:ATP-grasp domain-containing protein [Nitrospina sp.]MBT6716396.1 ATP-grasp domain-containing protein [Nitrospina sp.]